MGNKDHIQRANADKESCQNCVSNQRKFNQWPCKECKGTNDMFLINPDVPPVITGEDLRYDKYTGKQFSTLRKIKTAILMNPSESSILCPGCTKADGLTDCTICQDMFPELNTDIDCPCFSGRSVQELLRGIDSMLDRV